MKQLPKNIILFVIAIIVIGAILSNYTLPGQKPEAVSVNRIVQEIQEDDIDRIEIKEDTILVYQKSEDLVLETTKEPGQALSELLIDYGVSSQQLAALSIEVKDQGGRAYILRTLLPSLLPLLLLIFIFWIMFRQMQGANSRAMSFGQSTAREVDKKKNKISFKDVAGADEAKDELEEVVQFLKDPKKFVALGAKLPKGVLLMGQPGTGKTLLARAVAGEAGVPFFHMSGSEFVEMFVGVGASRVRDLFGKAKKSAPCIIFIDEIDAVGRKRGAGLGGGHDEREQTLNQILVEMDGFDPHLGVIVLAATNRPDVLDPALLRPGRFDRQIIIDPPDLKSRKAILKIHAKGKPLVKDVDFELLAQRTVGFAGADLANLLNEAAILAAKKDKKQIEMNDILPSIEKVMIGPERKTHILSKEGRRITAYHEAGHALVAHMLEHADPVHKISIISRGRAAGYTMKLPIEDKKLHMRREFIDEMAVLMGGFSAEKVFFGDMTTGASDDLRKATQIAKQLVMKYGMSSDLGPRTFGKTDDMVFLGKEISEQRDYSEALAEKIDAEINSLVTTAQETADRLIRENKELMEKIAQTLLDKEVIEEEEFETFFDEHPNLQVQERRKRREERKKEVEKEDKEEQKDLTDGKDSKDGKGQKGPKSSEGPKEPKE